MEVERGRKTQVREMTGWGSSLWYSVGVEGNRTLEKTNNTNATRQNRQDHDIYIKNNWVIRFDAGNISKLPNNAYNLLIQFLYTLIGAGTYGLWHRLDPTEPCPLQIKETVESITWKRQNHSKAFLYDPFNDSKKVGKIVLYNLWDNDITSMQKKCTVLSPRIN